MALNKTILVIFFLMLVTILIFIGSRPEDITTDVSIEFPEVRSDASSGAKNSAQHRHSSRRQMLPDQNSATVDTNKIKLLALFNTHDIELASAVILVEEVGAYRYRVGDYIWGNLLLAGIQRDKVVLENEGQRIEIIMTLLEGSIDHEHQQVATIENEIPAPVDQASSIRDAALKQADLTPVVEGSPQGYLVGERFPQEARKSTGVQPGDIIVAVNGYSVGNLDSDLVAWSTMQQFERSVITVRRDNSEFEVSYP